MQPPDGSKLRILYAGPRVPGSLSVVRCSALEELGPSLVWFDYVPFERVLYGPLAIRAVRRVFPRMFLGPINRAFVAAVEEARPDIVYVDKGIFFTEGTIRRTMEVRSPAGVRPVFLHFHPDDAFNPLIYHDLYEKTVPLWDCHFIPHHWVIDQLRTRGAKRVEYWPFGYYPPVHSPLAAQETAAPDVNVDVAFVGRFERGRANDLERLVREGIDVGIWGTSWDNLAAGSPLRPAVRWRSAIGRELAAVATRSKISLGFLSDTSINGHTSRTFEIPACGGFMLAQRSDGQLEFFEEGKEMVCFDSYDEMRDKIRWYLSHDAEREKIRLAGLERCRRSGYSYVERFRFVLRVAGECRAGLGQGTVG